MRTHWPALTNTGETDHALSVWSARYLESLQGLKDLRVPLRLANLMREAGFVDVEDRMIQLHTCEWSNGAWCNATYNKNADLLMPKRGERQRNRQGESR